MVFQKVDLSAFLTISISNKIIEGNNKNANLSQLKTTEILGFLCYRELVGG